MSLERAPLSPNNIESRLQRNSINCQRHSKNSPHKVKHFSSWIKWQHDALLWCYIGVQKRSLFHQENHLISRIFESRANKIYLKLELDCHIYQWKEGPNCALELSGFDCISIAAILVSLITRNLKPVISGPRIQCSVTPVVADITMTRTLSRKSWGRSSSTSSSVSLKSSRRKIKSRSR